MSFLAFNEDSTHFFGWHPSSEMTRDGLDQWVDQYADSAIRDLVLCLNCQRSSVACRSRQAAWDGGYDPEADCDQPFFQGVREGPWVMPGSARAHMRQWVHNAWLLHSRGIDPYAHWLTAARARRMTPWVSMRMNDIHYVDQPDHCIHDRFWREHPEYRRDPGSPYNGQCLDYGEPAVREYQMAYLAEMAERYDMDGFELDWMRNPYNFRPGQEAVGNEWLAEFIAEARGILDRREQALGHRIELGVRVPGRVGLAGALGLDPEPWARRGLVDRVVVSPFICSDSGLDIRAWRDRLADTGVRLGAGLVCAMQAYRRGERGSPNMDVVRGLAAALLEQGADYVYLFNFMDNRPKGVVGEEFRSSLPAQADRMLRHEAADVQIVARGPRRHVLTSSDLVVPEAAVVEVLPVELAGESGLDVTLECGPAPADGQVAQVRLGLADATAGVEVAVNGVPCPAAGAVEPPPEWTVPTVAFAIPDDTLVAGSNRLVVRGGDTSARVTWAEIAISAPNAAWPDDAVAQCPFHPQSGYR